MKTRDYFAGIALAHQLKMPLESFEIMMEKERNKKTPLGLIMGKYCYELADFMIQASKEKPLKNTKKRI